MIPVEVRLKITNNDKGQRAVNSCGVGQNLANDGRISWKLINNHAESQRLVNLNPGHKTANGVGEY